MAIATRRSGFIARCCRIVCATVVGLSCAAGSKAAADAPDWLVDARAGWKRYASRRLPGRWIESSRAKSRRGESADTEVLMHMDGRIVLFRAEGSDPDFRKAPKERAESATVINERYHFFVEKPSRNSDVWGVSTVIPIDEIYDHPEWMLHDAVDHFRLSPISANGEALLSEVLASDFAKITSTKAEDVDGKRQFRVDFEWSGPEKSYRFPQSKHYIGNGKYTVWLDPKNDWVVVRSMEEPTDGAWKSVVSREFDEATGWLRKEVSVWYEPSGKEKRRLEITIEDIDDKYQPPRELFYLPAYGIPEPEQLAEKSSRWWIVALVGVGLVFVGMWLLRSRKSG